MPLREVLHGRQGDGPEDRESSWREHRRARRRPPGATGRLRQAQAHRRATTSASSGCLMTLRRTVSRFGRQLRRAHPGAGRPGSAEDWTPARRSHEAGRRRRSAHRATCAAPPNTARYMVGVYVRRLLAEVSR
ncbi:MAG: hypothetical protein MZU79_00340 [Anaerotruncus sp.]|nr:hypothetical protein [Anaerotruncus sp.]